MQELKELLRTYLAEETADKELRAMIDAERKAMKGDHT